MKTYIRLLVLSAFAFLVGCSSAKTEVYGRVSAETNLIGTHWKLTVLNDKELSKNETPRREAHIIFNHGIFNGNTGCNNMRGSYVASENKISFSDKGLMTTMMYCEGSVENEFLQVLKNIYRYELRDEHLELYDSNDVKLAQFESVRF